MFRNEISRARTFGFMRDVENLWKAGLALGASLNNTIALADDRIMNREGLRYPQEFVRHKMLDAMGDLALAGTPMLWAPTARCAAATGSTPRRAGAARGYEAWTMVRAPWVRETVSPRSSGVAAVNCCRSRSAAASRCAIVASWSRFARARRWAASEIRSKLRRAVRERGNVQSPAEKLSCREPYINHI